MNCVQCARIIDGRKRSTAKYCSDDCKHARERQEYYKLNPPSGLAKSTVGAISELRVAVDLLRRGYSVFRSMSPACPCDLIILKNQHVLRVEVKTAFLSPRGGTMYAHPRKHEEYDILVQVLPDSIIYEPSNF